MLPRKGSRECSHECSRKCTRECPTKVGFLCVIIPYKGSHSSAHVSADAGAHASVHEVAWSYVTWSVFTCSVPYPTLEFSDCSLSLYVYLYLSLFSEQVPTPQLPCCPNHFIREHIHRVEQHIRAELSAHRLLAMPVAINFATPSACYRGPKPQKCPTWLGEGAKGGWTQGAKVSQESSAPPKPCFAPVQPFFAPVHQAFGPHTPKHLLHPLLTTFGNYKVLGPCSRHLGSQD